MRRNLTTDHTDHTDTDYTEKRNMERVAFDPDAYCSGHITGRGDNPDIAAFPDNFVTEALALGAEPTRSANGFVGLSPLFTDPFAMAGLPALDEQAPALRVLDQIRNCPAGKTRLLKANGPYSILASLAEPTLFYRWLSKNPAQIHRALALITAGLSAYIRKAFAAGIELLSLADPYANPAVLGERRCREFAGAYLAELLRNIAATEYGGRVVHLCPHNSVAMEQSGLIRSEALAVETGAEHGASYMDTLLGAGNADRVTLLGHQCIYAKNAEKIVRLAVL